MACAGFYSPACQGGISGNQFAQPQTGTKSDQTVITDTVQAPWGRETRPKYCPSQTGHCPTGRGWRGRAGADPQHGQEEVNPQLRETESNLQGEGLSGGKSLLSLGYYSLAWGLQLQILQQRKKPNLKRNVLCLKISYYETLIIVSQGTGVGVFASHRVGHVIMS